MVATKKRTRPRRARYGYKIQTKRGWYVRLFFKGSSLIITTSLDSTLKKVRGNVEHARWRSHEKHSGFEMVKLTKKEYEELKPLCADRLI